MEWTCRIDWAAWGTWAAVVVALGIALRDIFQQSRRRKAETAILALLIHQELALLRIRTTHLCDRLMPGGNKDAGRAKRSFEEWQSRTEFMEQEAKFETPVLKNSVDRLFALPHVFSVELTKVLTSVQAVKRDLACFKEDWTSQSVDSAEFYEMICEHATLANESVKHALNECAKHMK